MHGSPKFLTSLFPHATRLRPRRSHRALANSAPLLLASVVTNTSPSGAYTYGAGSLWGGASPLRPAGFSVYASVMSFGFLLPSHPQDSIRIEGLALGPYGFRLWATFGRDLHPARDAKLRLAHSIGIGRKTHRPAWRGGRSASIFRLTVKRADFRVPGGAGVCGVKTARFAAAARRRRDSGAGPGIFATPPDGARAVLSVRRSSSSARTPVEGIDERQAGNMPEILGIACYQVAAVFQRGCRDEGVAQ